MTPQIVKRPSCLLSALLLVLCLSGTAIAQPGADSAEYDWTDSLVLPTAMTQPAAAAATTTSPPLTPKQVFPTVTVTGFFHADAAWFQQNNANTALLGDIPDVAEFRRARLAAKGQVAENVGYMIEFDFAFPGRPTFMDVYVEAQKMSFGTLRVGQWRQPFGLDATTSARELLFLERALPFTFIPFRQIGVGAFDALPDNLGSYAVSAYRFQADNFGGTFGDGGYGTSGRFTTPIIFDDTPGESTVLHLGGSYSYNRPSTGAINYRAVPEFGTNFGDFNGTPVPGPFYAATGPMPTHSLHLMGAELAYSYESFLMQAEYIRSNVNLSTGGNHSFQGASVQGTYVLTGERHPYDAGKGIFTRVVPTHNFGDAGEGAWELAARWSWIDLNDGTVAGRELHDATLGVNWYLNKYTKLQFNYIRSFLNNPATGDSYSNIYAMRAQLDF